MAEAVYILCALTSFACAGLLIRSWWKTRMRLLMWSSLCFVLLAANNILLFIDLVELPGMDLSLARSATALAALVVLLFGLIGDAA